VLRTLKKMSPYGRKAVFKTTTKKREKNKKADTALGGHCARPRDCVNRGTGCDGFGKKKKGKRGKERVLYEKKNEEKGTRGKQGEINFKWQEKKN